MILTVSRLSNNHLRTAAAASEQASEKKLLKEEFSCSQARFALYAN